MNEPLFVPGELVLIESPTDSYLNGTRTVVTSAERGHGIDFLTGENGLLWFYSCEVMPRSGEWLEYDLRKLPPSTPTQFDAAIWQPKKVTA